MLNSRKPLLECLNIIDNIDRELGELHDSLPQEYLFDEKNFFLRAYTPSRTTFLMLHTWWHQTYCDLFRFAIPGFREGLSESDLASLPQDYISTCREKCLAHALSVSSILEVESEHGLDIITDPGLAMCAFHSARVISRLGHPPLGNKSQAELTRKLEACSNALEKQAKVYHRSCVLRDGILELVQDAQATPRGAIWNNTNYKRTETAEATQSSDAESQTREVFSKLSVTAEIRKLTFQKESRDEQTESRRREKPFQRLSSSANQSDSLPVQDTTGGLLAPTTQPNTSVDIQLADPDQMLSHAIDLSMQDERNDRSATLFGDMFSFDFGTTIAIDPRFQQAQPDMFMDSFWPLPEVSDSVMPSTE